MNTSDGQQQLLDLDALIFTFDEAVRVGTVRELVAHMPIELGVADIRAEFVDHIRKQWPARCWQDLWDEWVDTSGGTVTVWTRRCGQCRGRRIDMRVGSPCQRCRGTGTHYHPVTVTARHAPR